MSLALDLLEQATHLATREPKRPKQASLRRSVSSAYYALFHLLITDAAASAAPNQPDGLRAQVQRAFSHGDMKNVCKTLVAGNVAFASAQSRKRPFTSGHTLRLFSFPLEPDLLDVLKAFIDLQEARHAADYDVTASFNRLNVLRRIEASRDACAAWNRVKTTPNGSVLRAALLLQRLWSK